MHVASHRKKPAWLLLLLKTAEAAAASLAGNSTSPVPSWVAGLALKVIRVWLERL